ncbi:MAG: tetraacyldisaccharide 4'-kinase [Bacteroidota bacterium]|nr:tetraacyldisaccharide 4'-kinase [Bacteroidota bacterium]
MNFNSFLLRSFRILLLPFALLYGLIITIRNWLFDKKILKSATFNFPLICVGNLSVGGTGKSPMVEYLIEVLKDDFLVATLSRGYKRKTKGYALANETTTALEIGDEPMQFHAKFPDIAVAVGEERMVAIPQMLQDKPGTDVIILDDAFQHRYVNAGLNILLSDFSNMFYDDWFLPSGDLRDQRKSYKRAQIIVVTKCPSHMKEEKKNNIAKRIHLIPNQPLFFTSLQYGKPYHILTKATTSLTQNVSVLLVCGIANPKPLKKYLAECTATYDELLYADHHIFSIDDLKKIKQQFEKMQGSQKLILTTEKDAVRLHKFNEELQNLPLFVLPIKPKFLFGEEEKFDALVRHFIKNF